MNHVDHSPTEGIEPIHVSVADAARILGISPHHCNRLLNAEQIDSRYLGKRRLVVLSSLRQYAADLPASPAAS